MASRMGALLHKDPNATTLGDAQKEAAAAAGGGDDEDEKAAAGARPIAIGDLVIVYEGFGKQKAVTLTDRGQYQNRYGNFFHRDWVGKSFGSKVYGKGNAGFVWLLVRDGTPSHHRVNNKRFFFFFFPLLLLI